MATLVALAAGRTMSDRATVPEPAHADLRLFGAAAVQTVTARVTPQFAGKLRVRRQAIADFTNRSSEIFNVGGTPVAMTAGA